ncbi:MAG: BON domain-containing protein [Chitinophagaceae bacterium]|nr:BON domain-containing protein [Oligoflexus sp.]
MGDSSNTSANASANSVASTDAGADSSAAVNPQADNSKVNRISNGVVGLSAEQQGNSKTDVEITRKIRRAIISNKSLSTYAHNVKIITRDGRVVLKGPVRSVDERRIIEDSAVTVAGADHVSSGLEIKMK